MVNPFDKIKQVRDVLKSGTALVNPLRNTLTNATASVDRIKGAVNAAGIGTPLAVNGPTILASIGTLETSLSRLGIHSDSLSGIGYGKGLNNVDIMTIGRVASTVRKYSNESASCSLINNAFGVIVKAAQIANQIQSLMNQAENLLNFPDQIPMILGQLESAIEQQIEADLLAFSAAQIEALEIAAASALSEFGLDPCLSEVIGIIGGGELKKVVIPEVRGVV